MICLIALQTNALVHDWKDKSKSGFAIQPRLLLHQLVRLTKSNQIGNRGAMRFDGVNDHFFATTALRSEGVQWYLWYREEPRNRKV